MEDCIKKRNFKEKNNSPTSSLIEEVNNSIIKRKMPKSIKRLDKMNRFSTVPMISGNLKDHKLYLSLD